MNDNFYEAFNDSTSGAFRECGCGKFHYDHNYQYDDETHIEIDGWIEEEEKHPDKFQSHDGSIGAVLISGVTYVPDCTCRRIEMIQEIIDKNAASIAEYLRAKAKDHKAFAEAIAV